MLHLADGFDLCLAGHLHSGGMRDDLVLYPGSPEPLAWDETGRHCVAVVELVPGRQPGVDLVDFNRRRYAVRNVNCEGARSSRIRRSPAHQYAGWRGYQELWSTRKIGVAPERDPRIYAHAIDALLSPDSSLVDLVEAVRVLPYGRPSDRTVEGMLRERRGTCSTKHLFLARVLADHFPETEPLLIHRVYQLDRARAGELLGARVAEVMPEDGLVDVHRYLTIAVEGQQVTVDATFPGTAWDGRSSLPLACGSGPDYPAGEDPDTEKRMLEEQHCNAAIREPFIAALARWHDPACLAG